VEINLNKYEGRVSKVSLLKKEIIVKSPKVITEEKEKTYKKFFLNKGKIIFT
tara:strand:+ start:358 stop:513 length:156 start_codon:yes stop_codon:yes gene_type:complete